MIDELIDGLDWNGVRVKEKHLDGEYLMRASDWAKCVMDAPNKMHASHLLEVE